MTMANLQKLNPTQQELYNYLEQQTGQVNFEVLQPFTTQEMGAVLHISRNTVSQYLNEFFKEGWMVKINTRPVYYFLRETLSRKFNVQTLDSEYEDLQFLQQDLNHGRRADSCFAGVIGYHLSLKSAVEKCRVAVEYPPTGLPLVLAGVHLCFAFPFIHKLLMLFNLDNKGLLIGTTAVSFAVFAVLYAIVYKLTGNTYYRIVAEDTEKE